MSGYVTDVCVRNDQVVHKGDILFVVDQDRYRLALADAEATASARLAQHQFERRSKLTVSRTITEEDLDNSRRQFEPAASSYQQLIVSRELAELNLNRTEVRAAVNGFVNQNLSKGDYASPSKTNEDIPPDARDR